MVSYASLIADAFITHVAVLGTTRTLMPRAVKSFCSVLMAVVLPEQAPPVMQTRWMLTRFIMVLVAIAGLSATLLFLHGLEKRVLSTGFGKNLNSSSTVVFDPSEASSTMIGGELCFVPGVSSAPIDYLRVCKNSSSLSPFPFWTGLNSRTFELPARRSDCRFTFNWRWRRTHDIRSCYSACIVAPIWI